MNKFFLLFLCLFAFLQVSIAQIFSDISAPLTGVSVSASDWGDYDRDNDLDLLIIGHSGTATITKIYRNMGGDIFSELSLPGIVQVQQGAVQWGDYDNDQDLDILIAGTTGSVKVAKIYTNNAGSFEEFTGVTLDGIQDGSVNWGDYDNDTDLDILISGVSAVGEITKIYRNNGNNTFSALSISGIANVRQSSVIWGDYDGDNDLDILLTGSTNGNETGRITKIYTNNGDETYTELSQVFSGLYFSSADWGDYDNDGDLDFVISGDTSSSSGSHMTKIYKNNGNNTFSLYTASIIDSVSHSSVKWGDYDNDNDLDLLVAGSFVSKVYTNEGGVFTELQESFPGVFNCSVSWGDYDNDSDLDFVVTGEGNPDRVAKIFKNSTVIAGILPTIESEVKIYPNPVLDVIKIKNNFSEYFQIIITDQLGQEVKSIVGETDNNDCEIDLSLLKEGIYFVQLISGEKKMSSYFVKY